MGLFSFDGANLTMIAAPGGVYTMIVCADSGTANAEQTITVAQVSRVMTRWMVPIL